MNIIKITLLTAVVLASHVLPAMESTPITKDYVSRKASASDIAEIVDLVNTQAFKDSNNLVIVPKVFRQGYFETAVLKSRLFVVCRDRKIVGYKKLFCITDKDELSSIMNDELRLPSDPVTCSSLSIDTFEPHAVAAEEVALLLACPTVTYIYDGADFTHPDYRSRGINSALTAYALATSSDAIMHDIRTKASTHIAMLYGLTCENAGKEDDLLGGRSHGILKQFIPLIQSLALTYPCAIPRTLLLSRHHAFKPSFDEDATTCIPLPDSHSIAGYGCLIACALDKLPAKEALS